MNSVRPCQVIKALDTGIYPFASFSGHSF